MVQRLDGVYHPGLGGRLRYLYALRNLRLRLIRNHLADYVIYHTRFAESICDQMLGASQTNSSIIYNGVNTAARLVRPASQSEAIQLATAAHFRRRDQLLPILAALPHLTIPFTLHIFGSCSDILRPLLTAAARSLNIIDHGPYAQEEFQSKLSGCDIFLFSDQSACPNVVLEALSAALPVVAYDRGSLPELIEPHISGELVTLPPHDPLRAVYPFDKTSFRNFARAIQRVAESLRAYQDAARQRAINFYDIREKASQYEDILRPS